MLESLFSLFVERASSGFAQGLQPALVREPAVAGIWYPANKEELNEEVRARLSAAKVAAGKQPSQKLLALMVPHAGYVFCADVAAHAYKLLMGKSFQTVIIIGPAHYYPVSGAALPETNAFKTPLGDVPIDTALAEKLRSACPLVTRNSLAHLREHCIESQLPFLQVTLRKFKLLPLLTGNLALSDCQKLARSIADLVKGKSVLLIASSDMSHYPRYDDARRVDKKMLAALKRLDAKALVQTDEQLISQGTKNLECTLCGLSAVLTVWEAAKRLGGERVEVLKYANSGDVSPLRGGNKERVVGYGAVAVYGKGRKAQGVQRTENAKRKRQNAKQKEGKRI